jgi:hypothetical protein
MHCSIAALALVLPIPVEAEETATNSVPTTALEHTENPWSFSTYVYGYLVPDSRDYVNPNVTADRGWLHLEARYNYEALETGSVWVGYNFTVGENSFWRQRPWWAASSRPYGWPLATRSL